MKKNRDQETYIDANAAASTALTTLKGIIAGVTCDNELNDLERTAIFDWIEEYEFLKSHPAVGSVFDYLSLALADGVLNLEEAEDIRWMIERNLVSFYDAVTQKIQELLGLLTGIAADDEIKAVEFTYLWQWLNNNEDLKGIFPFDEIYSMVCQIGTRRQITAEERKFLLSAFKWTDQAALLKNSPFFPWEIDPEISFTNREFCITGISDSKKRSDLEMAIESRGGRVSPRVTKRLSFLVVCTQPNRAWTHACYGRKIEAAVKLRKSGVSLAIVSEIDLLDALRD